MTTPTKAEVDALARWMQRKCRENDPEAREWDALPDQSKERIRHVARALLTTPPAVLVSRLNGPVA
jgi:hypothetical protein